MEQEIIEYLKERKVVKASRNSSEFLKKTNEEQSSVSSLEVKDFQRSVIAVSEVDTPAPIVAPGSLTLDAINEKRVGELEAILKISRKDSAALSERIKILEDKVLWIEEHYPQVAYSCFDYTQVKVQEKKGRITHLKQYSHPVETSQDTEIDTGKEIIRRMEELRKKLKKN